MAPLAVVRVAGAVSRTLTQKEIPHALAGGLAVGCYGFERWTSTIEFVVPRRARRAINQLWTTSAVSAPLQGVVVTTDHVNVTFWFVSSPLHAGDLSLPTRSGEPPILRLEALVSSKAGSCRSIDLADTVELLKLGRVPVDDVSNRLSGDPLTRFRDLVEIAALEAQGKPKEGRRILLRLLTESARLQRDR